MGPDPFGSLPATEPQLLESDRPQKWQKQGAKGQDDPGKGQHPRQSRPSEKSSAKGHGKGRQQQQRQNTGRMDYDYWSEEALYPYQSEGSHSPPRQLVHGFHPHRSGGQLGEDAVPDRGDMEDSQGEGATTLEAPMRVVLYQALLTTVASRFEQLMSNEESKANAVKLGWITEDAGKINMMKWDSEAKRHVIDHSGNPLEVQKVLSMVMELVVLSKEPLVVNRFHATRPMTGEMEATTMPMLLDIGLRSQAADKAWGLLRDLCGSAVWLAAGVNVRPDRLQRGPLAQRLATMQTKSQWWHKS